jgi:hypothetical protein
MAKKFELITHSQTELTNLPPELTRGKSRNYWNWIYFEVADPEIEDMDNLTDLEDTLEVEAEVEAEIDTTTIDTEKETIEIVIDITMTEEKEIDMMTTETEIEEAILETEIEIDIRPFFFLTLF